VRIGSCGLPAVGWNFFAGYERLPRGRRPRNLRLQGRISHELQPSGAYVQNNFLALDITQLLGILKNHPAARRTHVDFLFDRSAPPKVIEHDATGH
jgi:hypothetical protein